VAAIYGSWASGVRRPDSDIDVLVVGDATLAELRRLVRPLGKATGRRIDLTVLRDDEFVKLRDDHSSFLRRLLEAPITLLVGDLASIGS
jgi:predicted nucleotidyltransferase